MFKRSFKNVLLFCSITLAFVLVWQIWFSGYFLPDGYDYVASGFRRRFITPIVRLFGGDEKANFAQDFKHLFMPEKIVLNHSGTRVVLQDGHEDFMALYQLSGEVAGEIFSGGYPLKTKETVDVDTYFSLLKGKSIYVDYGRNCDFRLFSSAVGDSPQSAMSNDLSIVDGYIISLHDGIMNDVSLYIQDKRSNNIYRYVVEIDKNMLETQMKEYVQTPVNGVVPSYSFELNFHKEQTDAASKILFRPLVLLDLIPKDVPRIKQAFSEEKYQLLYEELSDTILDVFSINSRTMRRYTDLENARVFVENNANLTLYPDGVLEYQTVQGGRGLDISDGADRNNYDIYTATSNAVDFVAKLCRYMPSGYFENLQINTDLINSAERQNTYKISFDYYVDGMPVRRKTEQGYAAAVEMEISGGFLTSYRHYIKVYEKEAEGSWQMVPQLSAADGLVNALYSGEKPLQVERISRCYIEREDGTFGTGWYSMVDGVEQIME